MQRPVLDPVTRRWVLACGLAEAVGMTAAAGAAKVSQAVVAEPERGAAIALALLLVVAGGLVEGVSLGSAQAWAFGATHPDLARARYVAVTVVFAGLGWAAASAPAALAGSDPGGPEPSRALVVVGGAALGLTMGCLLGAVQAWVLRPTLARPGRWVLANAAAWVPAMAVIFVGATAPEAGWSLGSVLLVGALTGATAGAVLGLVLGSWVPRLGHATKPHGNSRSPRPAAAR